MRVSTGLKLGLLAFATGAALATFMPAQSSALVIVHCAGRHGVELGLGTNEKSAGIHMIDPIVQRGDAMSMHEHQFFGFGDWDKLANKSLANYSDLLGGRTSCDLPKDSAAYWAPVLRKNDGSLVKIQRMESYYRPWNSGKVDNLKQTQVMPPDLRMVAGNAKAVSAADVNRKTITWSCGNFSSKAQRLGHMYPSAIEADCSTATGTSYLTVAVRYPTCWDGMLNDHTMLGNTADFSGTIPSPVKQHLTYKTSKGCPAGYPIKLPELTMNTSWDYRGNGKDLVLSSGSIYSYHADFLNAWDPAFFKQMVDTCINVDIPRDQEPTLHFNYPEVCGPPIKQPN
ncbi:DUF1996 domain-containing protein [Candidatus Saccharibacteria bacterium]|nr:DUF1996 domain-containing protein [Candidatus Saccharibacteria bacterium]